MVTKKPSIHKKKLKKLEIADTVRHELRNNTKKLKSLRETSFPLAYFWVPRHPARYYAARSTPPGIFETFKRAAWCASLTVGRAAR